MQETSITHSPIINVFPELFINICAFLPPADLFSLSQVNHKFRGYLRAQNSFSTQQIWKESRLQFMPKEDMPPPKGMSEEKYVELLMMERGCQICKRSKKCKIYWEFAIRCCGNCHSNKTISQYKLIIGIDCPREFIDVIPFNHFGFIFCIKYYWIEQIDLEYSQYYSLSDQAKKFWLDDKKHLFNSIMQYAERRERRELRELREYDLLPFYPHSRSNCYFRDRLLFAQYLSNSLPSPSQLSSFLVNYMQNNEVTNINNVNERVDINNVNEEVNISNANEGVNINNVNEEVNINNVNEGVNINNVNERVNINKRVNSNINDIPQLIQFHIQRLENGLYQPKFNVGAKLTNNYHENSNEKKRNNFIKIQKQKSKKGFNNEFNTFIMKGKNSKNKFAHIYG